MYTLQKRTKTNIEKIIKMPIEDIKTLNIAQEKLFVEKQTGKSLDFSKKRKNSIIGRGNPLLARKKIRTMQEVDQKLTKILEG